MLLGLAVAAAYGAADFFGGLSSKRSPLAAVVVLSQLCGLPVLVLLIIVAGGDPTARALLLGAIAGAIGGTGLACLYRGLSRGRMSVVAPITAVGAAIVPVLYGIAGGERPSPLATAGVALALAAVVLISRAPDSPAGPAPKSTLALACYAGAAFGTVFVLLSETGDWSGFWPLVAGRSTSIVLLAVGALVTGRSLTPSGTPALRLIATTGALDLAANVLYLLASRRGLLAVVAVLSSLYPAVTVLLARLVLSERLFRPQVAGLVLAGTGVVLIASG